MGRLRKVIIVLWSHILRLFVLLRARYFAAIQNLLKHGEGLRLHIPRHRYARSGLSGLIVLGLIAMIILPALQAHAATLTWSNAADFGFNQPGVCGATTMTNLVINSPAKYTDATCQAAAQDASISLAKNVNSTGNLTTVKAVAVGGTYSLALLTDGTVWSWGNNTNGQLGDGTVTQKELPTQVVDASGQNNLIDITAISAGATHALALKSDGTVWSWGNNGSGQLGNGTTTQSVKPVQVTNGAGGYISGITAIAAGGTHSLALGNDGSIWAWGDNSSGQLGDNTLTGRTAPVRVKDAGGATITGVASITAGAAHSLAVKTDKTALAWGNNVSGRLGDGTTTNRQTPVPVKDIAGTGTLQNVLQLSAGGTHSLGLLTDGTVVAWGSNAGGRLGDGTTTNRSLPVQVKDSAGTGQLSGIAAVSAGISHSLAATSTGGAWAWGDNTNGQLGDGTTTNRSLPVQVKDVSGTGLLSGVGSINAGGDSSSASAAHSFALGTDGTISAWGGNTTGQLGDGTLNARSLPAFVKEKVVKSTLSGVKQVVAGANFTIALKTDGTVWAWGSNSNGQLGDGTTTRRELPTQVLNTAGTGYLGNITTIAESAEPSSSAFAIADDGTVWAWGYNGFGQLGDNTTSTRTLPVKVKDASGAGNLTNVVHISAGGNHTVAVKADGTVWAWGYNTSGQVGDNTTTQRLLPVQVKDAAGTGNLTGVANVTAGDTHSIALKTDGTIWAWGADNNGQLGDNATTQRPLPAQVKDAAGTGTLSGVASIAAGAIHSVALKTDGTVWAWGGNSNGQLGDNTTSQRNLPIQVKDAAGTGTLSGVASISAGSLYTATAKTDGTAWTWGANNYNQLGDNTATQRNLPVQVKDATGIGNQSGVAVVAAGSTHAVALKTDGTVLAWGNNSSAQLGDNTVISRFIPVQVRAAIVGSGDLTGIASVSTGSYYTVALKTDGTVWAWGSNSSGQLGDNTTTTRSLPVQVKDASGAGNLTGITSVAAGASQTLALKTDGTVWAWGSNSSGQLGDGTTTQRNLPVQVKDAAGTGNLTGVARIAAGGAIALAVKSDGTVWAWGTNGSGQLGDNTTTQRILPVQVKDAAGTGYLTGVANVSTGGSHVAALKTDGTVWAWGYNALGQLGDNTTTQRTLPVQVKDTAGTGYLSGISSIAVGSTHTVALKSGGTVWTWGSNSNGQIGDGTTGGRVLPTQVKDAAGTGTLSSVAAIAAGLSQTIVTLADGTTWDWGANNSGQLGDNTTTQRTLPVQVKDTAGSGNLTGITSVAGGASHAVAVKSDGTAFAWGDNTSAQLTGPFVRYVLPTHVANGTASGTVYYPTGTLSRIILDVGQGKKTQWQSVTWKSQALAAGTTIGFKTRTSQDGNVWSNWSSEYSQTQVGSTDGTGDLTSLPFSRFIEVQAVLTTSQANTTPTLNEFSISHLNDSTPPPTNASNVVMKRSQAGTVVSPGDWVNSPTGVFDWTAGQDNAGGSGVAGYCLYLGQDATADLTQTKGLLGSSPLNTDGVCQYTIGSTHLDLATAGTLGTALTSSNDPYYLKVKAIDASGNLFAGTAASASFKYDATAPKNVGFISLPSQFVPTKDVTITWPVSGDQASSDANSGIAGLQYRIGDTGTWYGSQHTGAQDATDVLNVSSGSYKTDATYDYPLLHEGNNIIYFRSIDQAGNVSASLTSGVIKVNTSAPSEPTNLVATPPVNVNNAFSFTWSPPQTFVGDAEKLTYCYTVNTLPSATTCAYTAPGQTSLAESSYATQPGANTLYVVARDEAGNSNYATAASVTFTANTAAPGVPLNAEIADISVKATSNWKLALSWEQPASTGAGVARYQILRSLSPTDGFTQVATTSGTSYVDGGLTASVYYYKLKACDSANHCGAETTVLSKLPTGRFTSPPELIGAPTVRVGARGATVSWTTDRTSDSRIQIGSESGKYRPSETSSSEQTKTHELKVDGLDAGTTYYYKVKWTDEDGNIGSSSEQSFTTLPAPIVKNVKVIKSSLDSASIEFTSVAAAKVSFQYGKSDNFGGLQSINTSATESTYIVDFDGLDDGTTYSFRPTAVDHEGFSYPGDTYTFSTPPRPKISNLRFQPVAGEPTSTQKVTWTTNVDATSVLKYGKNGQEAKDILSSKMTKEHEVLLRDLGDDSDYYLFAESRDAGGNLAVSDRQTFRTALDTRPPVVSAIGVETYTKGAGGEARGQIVVSWTTDEPSTSQVAYGEGLSSGEYLNKTAESTALTTQHVVIISDLTPSKVYYVQPISKDKAGNATTGQDQAAIIRRATQSALTVILDSLYKVFGVK